MTSVLGNFGIGGKNFGVQHFNCTILCGVGHCGIFALYVGCTSMKLVLCCQCFMVLKSVVLFVGLFSSGNGRREVPTSKEAKIG